MNTLQDVNVPRVRAAITQLCDHTCMSTVDSPVVFVLCSDNYIGALGASVIANALKKNKSLRELHMKGNELGDEGVKAICAALDERQAPDHLPGLWQQQVRLPMHLQMVLSEAQQ